MAAPVTASYPFGTTAWIDAASCSWVTPGLATTPIWSYWPGWPTSCWVVAVSNRAMLAPSGLSTEPKHVDSLVGTQRSVDYEELLDAVDRWAAEQASLAAAADAEATAEANRVDADDDELDDEWGRPADDDTPKAAA